MRRQIVFLGALACCFVPSVARATCLTRCEVRLVFDDCASPEGGAWPGDLPVALVVACGDAPRSETGAPEHGDVGPDGCRSSAEATQIQLSRSTDDRTFVPVEAVFGESGTCLGWPRLELDRQLAPGTYRVVQPTVFDFRVTDAPARETRRVQPAPLSCFECWGGGPPIEPQALPPPPRARGRAGCTIVAPDGSETMILGALALLLKRRRRPAHRCRR